MEAQGVAAGGTITDAWKTILVALMCLILGILIAVFALIATNPSPDNLVVIFGFLAILLTFLCIIFCGYCTNNELNQGEMRRAIAAIFVLALIYILFLSFFTSIEGNTLVDAFINFVGIVIGFYFGARTAEGKLDPPKTAA